MGGRLFAFIEQSSETKSVQSGELPDVIVSTEKVLSLLVNAMRDKEGWGKKQRKV